MASPAPTKRQILDDIIRREGGFVDNPNDRGGATKYGITIGTLSEVLGRQATVDEVRNLTEEAARNIYTDRYLAPFSGYNGWLFALLVDSAVQHGVGRVQGWLKEALADKTLDPYTYILTRRLKFYGTIISKNPSQALFAAGWLNRLAEFL